MRGVAFFLVVMAAAVAIGCNDYVYLSHLDYRPNLDADLASYRGQAIVLNYFYNRAEDTYLWYYRNLDRRLFYSTDDTVENYFYYCFYKAFGAAGLTVHPPGGAAQAPTFDLAFRSLTDAAATYQVTLMNQGRYFQKTYQVTFPAIPEKQFESEAALRQSAYRMVDLMVLKILTDPEFKKAFLAN
jgi:hypothetical protein